jgi:hypothetical protein
MTGLDTRDEPLFLADYAFYLRCMNQVSRLFEAPNFSLTQEDLSGTENRPSYFPITGMVLPALYRVFQLQTSMLANLRITNIGLDLIETHRTNTTYPETLQAWPHEAIQDPFTGASLVYRSLSNGFLLYSLGPK